MFFTNWINSGFKYVSALFNSNGFKPINEIKESLISAKKLQGNIQGLPSRIYQCN